MIIAPTGLAGVGRSVLIEARNASGIKVMGFAQAGNSLSNNDPRLSTQNFEMADGSARLTFTPETAGTIQVTATVPPLSRTIFLNVTPAAAKSASPA